MENKGQETQYVRDEIAKCEGIDDLRERIFPLIHSQKDQWAHKVHEILQETGYTKTRFAELCGVSRMSVDKWCKGAIPKNRETFLRIGMAAAYDVERMDQLLQRYGRYPGLYSKCLEDCICMYVLGKNYGSETIGKYQYILDKIKSSIIRDDSTAVKNVDTDEFDEKLSEVRDVDELERFITDNIAMFSYSYHKFYAYVKMCINANYQEYSSSVFDMAEGQGWSSSLRQCVSAIRQNKWYPTRNKIISLGLHLSMDHDQIDDMLKLAHMEPLCAKNIFESVIMFVLDDASLNNMLDMEAEDYNPDELCHYAREVLSELNLPELNTFISEVAEIDDAW